jgi:phosphatidylglycerophosphate synthase
MPGTKDVSVESPPERGSWWTLANGLTFVRVLLAPVCATAIMGGRPGLAFGVFWLAVLTDYVDGPVARYRGEASALGGLLDHATDAFFVTLGVAALAHLGLAPVALPALIAVAFIQYTLDSRALAGHRLRTSAVGRWNGIAYYVLLGTPVVRDCFGWAWPSDALVLGLGWLLVASTVVSIIDRGQAWLRTRS